MSGACASSTRLDGQLAGYVGAGQRVALHMPAGEVIMGARPNGVCAGGLV
jgi:hypothetical protein